MDGLRDVIKNDKDAAVTVTRENDLTVGQRSADHTQTGIHTDNKAKTEEGLSGLSEFLPSAHNQGPVQ